jgi:predicted DNA-binding ribbon-helix-helix protein
MKSPIVKRSIAIDGHKTSVSLEDAFWQRLKEIAGGRNMTLSDLVAAIDAEREHGNLSSAIRLFVLSAYRDQTSDNQADRQSRWLLNRKVSVQRTLYLRSVHSSSYGSIRL